MSAYSVRWALMVLLVGAWTAAMVSPERYGAAVHLLVMGAVALGWVQLRTRPALSRFELWQVEHAKPRLPVKRHGFR